MHTRQDIEKLGFIGYLPIHVLRKSRLAEAPKVSGVYVFLRADSSEPIFLSESPAGHFKGKNPTVAIDKLKAKWVSSTQVVYIGKAGKLGKPPTIKTRLTQYLDFGGGKPVGHWGGRYIWQLANAEELIVCWREARNQDPEMVESELLDVFMQSNGRLPFANLKRGKKK